MTYPQGTLKNFAVGSLTGGTVTPSVSPSASVSTKQVQHPGAPYPTIEQDITTNPPNKSLPKATVRNIYKYRREALLNQKVLNNSSYVSAIEDMLSNNIKLCNTLRNTRDYNNIWEAYKTLLYFGDDNIVIRQNLYNLSHRHQTQIKILKETAIILIIALFGVVLTLAPYGISLTLGLTGRLLERWGLGFLLLLLSGGVLAAITMFLIFLHKMAEGLLGIIIGRYSR